MKALPRTLLVCAVVLFAGMARAQVALPDTVARAAPWQLVGSGELYRLVFRIYEASLWQAGNTQALAIRYARRIPSTTLADTTVEELSKLGLVDAQRWHKLLLDYLPDVAEGDVIVAVKPPDAGIRFYFRGQRIGSISDPAFANTFFGIWLDPRTSEPGLRASLLGLTTQ
jgi:hypothetical protein